MGSKFRVQAVEAADADWLRAVAQRVFSAYDGNSSRWKLVDTAALWKIHLGVTGLPLYAARGQTACFSHFC